MAFKQKNYCKFLCLAALFLAASFPVRAYELQFSDKTQKTYLRWRKKTINLALSTSLLRQPAANIKSNSDVAETVKRSLATWEQAADVRFVVNWTDKQFMSPDENGDGVSLITFAATPENLVVFQNEAKDETGQTRVFFNKSGYITEADIVLNPFQKFSTDGSFGTFDLEAALTHEIGHLLGLAHSTVQSAAMYPQQGKNGMFNLPAFELRTLAEDDRAALRFLYGARGEEKDLCCRQISGVLQSSDGKPLKHWQVWAEETLTGRLAAAVTTQKDGSFQINGLKTGKYRVLTQPLDVNFNAETIGEFTLENENVVNLQRQITLRSRTIKSPLIGYRGQLSALALALSPDRSHVILVGGENYYFADFAAGRIDVNSTFLAVNQTSFGVPSFDFSFPVLSFEIAVDKNAPPGEYSLEMHKQNGENFYLPGCFSVKNH